MAGLPQDRPIPGTPLLDPLGQPAPGVMPVAPAPLPTGPMAPGLPASDPLAGMPASAPQGYQFDANGEPIPYPLDEWFGTPEGVPIGYEGHDVPVVENAPPAPQPPATTQVGPQALGALEQAREQGHPPAPAQPGPAREPSYLDTVNQAADLREKAAIQQGEAEKQKNLYMADEGTRIARDASEKQAAADSQYQKVYNEARTQRKVLDQEAQDIANTKIDPKRAWNNMSFGSQLFVAVTAALTGATTRAVQTGQNPVLDAIDKMVARDMEAQQADLDNRWKGNAVRRGLLADDLAAGRDMLDVHYKSLNAAYEMAANQAKSYAMRFDNPVIDARTATTLADIEERKATLGMQYEQAKQQQLYAREQDRIHNAQTNAQIGIARGHLDLDRWKAQREALAGPERNVQAEREDRERTKEEQARQIRGSTGETIGTAKTEDEAKAANQVVIHRKALTTLYKRGRELFKNDWAAPGTKLRLQQDAWNKNWAQERRAASGDLSAPNIKDQEIWGIDTSRTIGDNMDVLDESYNNAIALGRGTLEHSGVPEEVLIKEGFIVPEDITPPSIRVEPNVYLSDQGEYNTEGNGRLLDEKETAAYKQLRDKNERQSSADPMEWKYRRSQNNIAAASGRALPFPEVGTGSID